MKSTNFTEIQIVASIKKHEGRIAAKDIAWELGTSEAAFYNWKTKYGSMELSDVEKMK